MKQQSSVEMSRLEMIHYQPMKLDRSISDNLTWVVDGMQTATKTLPQIYHSSGEPWIEANIYALNKTETGKKYKTVLTEMTHLRAYAEWLENENLDWRHFPLKKKDRCVFRYRGHLINQRDDGELTPSGATARMGAILRFYRWAWSAGLIERNSLWEDRHRIIKTYSVVGLQRTFSVTSSELSIANRIRPGATLEGGLLPLNKSSTKTLLAFLKHHEMIELYWMFMIGFCTGARIETIRTLRLSTLDSGRTALSGSGVQRIPVGPPTLVRTKFDVSGDLLFPAALIRELQKYATSARRLTREAKASSEDRTLLFLTRTGRKYAETSFTSQMSKLRNKLIKSGFGEFEFLKFHQSRATFGTQLMSKCLTDLKDQRAALVFVRDAMLHKNEKTTWQYINFVKQSPLKEKFSDEFFAFYSGQDQYHTALIEEVVNGRLA